MAQIDLRLAKLFDLSSQVTVGNVGLHEGSSFVLVTVGPQMEMVQENTVDNEEK